MAVDPTSPFSGGAILGDRIRMQAHATDPGVFIRSMATRGHLGGLAAATDQALLVLAASGKDVILVETVGVGQDEVEIVGAADVSLVVLVPGLGDEVQALKAGIMEIADVFVVNKADREGVERVVAEIESMLVAGAGDGAAPPAIVQTVATRDEGTARCSRRSWPSTGGPARRAPSRAKRRAQLRRQLEDAVRERVMAHVFRQVAAPGRARRASWSGSSRAPRIPSPRPRSIVREDGTRMKHLKIDHLGIAVPSLEQAIAAYEALGFGSRRPTTSRPRR